MSWREPIWLWSLALLPFLAIGWWFVLRRRKRDVRRFASPERLAALQVGEVAGAWWWLRITLWLAAVASLGVALAGPRWGKSVRRLKSRGVDVVLVVDVSASMRAMDVRPSRFERMQAELLALLPRLAGHRVGAVAFAADTLEFPLTVDVRALELFLQDLSPERVPVQGTDLGGALVSAAHLLRRARSPGSAHRNLSPSPLRVARSSIVLLATDGEDHEGRLREGARALHDVGARLHAAIFAGRRPVRIPVVNEAGRRVGWVRDARGALAYSAFTPKVERALHVALDPLGSKASWTRWGEGRMLEPFLRALSSLKQGELKHRTVVRWQERFVWPLAVAMLLLVLESWLPRGRRREEAAS